MSEAAGPSLMFEALDGMSKLIEMSAGYRSLLERAGYSPTVAEQLAASYLNAMLTQAVQGTTE